MQVTCYAAVCAADGALAPPPGSICLHSRLASVLQPLARGRFRRKEPVRARNSDASDTAPSRRRDLRTYNLECCQKLVARAASSSASGIERRRLNGSKVALFSSAREIWPSDRRAARILSSS